MKTTQLTFENYEYQRYIRLKRKGISHKDIYLEGLSSFEEKEKSSKSKKEVLHE